MDIVHLPHDLHLVALQVTTFPDGIGEAFDTLKEKLGDIPMRSSYGISHLDSQGKVIYYAAASLADARQTVAGMVTLIIRKGYFNSIPIRQWENNIPAIPKDILIESLKNLLA